MHLAYLPHAFWILCRQALALLSHGIPSTFNGYVNLWCIIYIPMTGNKIAKLTRLKFLLNGLKFTFKKNC